MPGRQCTTGWRAHFWPRLDSDPRQPQRRPIITCSGLGGHSRVRSSSAFFAETQTPHRLFQAVHGQLSSKVRTEGLFDITVKLPVRRNVYDTKRLLEFFIHAGPQETLVEQHRHCRAAAALAQLCGT